MVSKKEWKKQVKFFPTDIIKIIRAKKTLIKKKEQEEINLAKKISEDIDFSIKTEVTKF